MKKTKKKKEENPLLPFWFEKKKEPTIVDKLKDLDKKFSNKPKLRMS
jgi:hypothetical protein